MYLSTALSAVRFVGFSTIPCENNHQITPLNARAKETQTAVNIEASLVFIICAFLLKTPRSNARQISINTINIIQTVSIVLEWF